MQRVSGLLTVLQHLHDVLFNHGQNDLPPETTGDSVQSALPGHGVTEGDEEQKPLAHKTLFRQDALYLSTYC